MASERQQQSPSWVFSLLTGKFFVPCLSHEDAKKNEKNVYCLDCCAPICSHCSHRRHRAHRLLQVRRYVYQDVVRLEDFENLFDCSFIQSYTTNNAKVVFLNQRPQSRPLKCSGSSCSSCERTLQQPYHFCSLGCKVSMVLPLLYQRLRYEGCAPVCSLPRSGGFPRPPGSPGPKSGDAGDGHPSPGASLLGGASCHRAPPGSSGAAGVARCVEPGCTAAREGLVITRKKRTRAVAAGGDTGAAMLCRSRNAPVHGHHHQHLPLASFKRKGIPIRSPLY
ncbi:hypothetical protein Taro_015498 [Colocasia esculenta]|uniref:B box-type domain-containing protein n=1 Tax=Colocasia esculenta TaxID=4460 RepID=A0A843UMI5_COLES|nr:hypothetical protein [Colocasia esculenta]